MAIAEGAGGVVALRVVYRQAAGRIAPQHVGENRGIGALRASTVARSDRSELIDR